MYARDGRKWNLSALLVAVALLLAACGEVNIGRERAAAPTQAVSVGGVQELTQEQIRATVEAEVRAPAPSRAAGGIEPGATETGGGENTPVAPRQETQPPVEATAPLVEEDPTIPPAEEAETPARPTEDEASGSVVEFGTAPPEPTNTPIPKPTNTPTPGPARVTRAVLLSGKPDPKATKGQTRFDLRDRQISLVGDLQGGPEYGSMKAEWELVETKGQDVQDEVVLSQYLSVREARPFAFSARFDLDNPPAEGRYRVKLSIDDKVIKQVPFTITAPAPRLIAEPGKRVQGGTGRLVIKIPKGTDLWEYTIIDESGEEVVQQYGNTLQYEETPGVHQLPAGTYIITVSPALGGGEGGLYRAVVAAGRESVVQLGALKLVSGQVPSRILLVDKATGRPAAQELTGGDRKESLLGNERAIPAGRYEVYFKSGSGEYVKVGDVEVRPNLVTTLRV